MIPTAKTAGAGRHRIALTCTPGGYGTLTSEAIPLTRIMSQPAETRAYTVQGMTCSHCVRSVREEVSDVAGVSAVNVELASGRLSVTGRGVTDEAIRDAVAEAGYEVASLRSQP